MYNVHLIIVIAFTILSVCFASSVHFSINRDLGFEGSRRGPREIPDECHFIPPHLRQPHQHPRNPEDDGSNRPSQSGPPPPPPICCELPDILIGTHETFDKCHRVVHETFHSNPHHHKRAKGRRVYRVRHDNEEKDLAEPVLRSPRETRTPEDTEEDVPQPREVSPADAMLERRECFANCVFNVSGYLLPDNMLNEELLNQKLNEVVSNDTNWAEIGDSVFKKCIAAAKEANSQSQKTCKSGAAEYIKCMNRELFFNCPSEIWLNNSECAYMKSKMEKCPNLMPPHPMRHRHPHHHHHHHHHHYHFRRPQAELPVEKNVP